MKKDWIFLTFVLLCLHINQPAFCQSENFDIITYSPPKGWKKDAQTGVINYTTTNASSGAFCVIALYASSPGTGDAKIDFKNEWKELVSDPFNVKVNPQTETQTTEDGWKAIAGAAQVKVEGLDVFMILTVFSGFGKTVSIRTSLNDLSFVPQLESLLETLTLDKTSQPAVTNNTTIPTIPSGSPGQFGKMSYTAPAGWSQKHYPDGVVFKPLDIPADEQLSIQIMQPLQYSGNLEQALAQSFDEVTALYNTTSMYQADGKYGKKAVQRSFNGWDYIRGKGSVKAASGAELGLELFLVKINNRYERVAILESRTYCAGVSQYFTTDRIQYRNAIESLLFSMQFSDFNTAPLKPGSANGNGIIGVWEGTIQSTGAATGVKLEVFTPVFFNNGQVYFGNKFPDEGLDGLNSRIPPELYPRNWGTYTFSNGQGILKMGFADLPFRTEEGKILVTKNQRDWPFYKKKSVDGARFNGTYRMSESYEKLPMITFTTDGRFNDNGAIRVLYHEYTNCVNPGFKPGSGTYEVKNHTIHFTYSDGRIVRIAFLGTDYNLSNPSPATLRMSWNDDLLTRQ